MIHEHQFLMVAEVSKPIPDSQRFVSGIISVCSSCGEIRHIFADGIIKVVKEGAYTNGRPDPDHVQPTEPDAG